MNSKDQTWYSESSFNGDAAWNSLQWLDLQITNWDTKYIDIYFLITIYGGVFFFFILLSRNLYSECQCFGVVESRGLLKKILVVAWPRNFLIISSMTIKIKRESRMSTTVDYLKTRKKLFLKMYFCFRRKIHFF